LAKVADGNAVHSTDEQVFSPREVLRGVPRDPSKSLAHKVDRLGKTAIFAGVLAFNVVFWSIAIRKYTENSNVDNFL